MALDADAGRLFQTGGGGEVAAEVPEGICLHRAAHGLEYLGQSVGQSRLPARGVGDGGEGAELLDNFAGHLGELHNVCLLLGFHATLL